jgi:hypothetical protein
MKGPRSEDVQVLTPAGDHSFVKLRWGFRPLGNKPKLRDEDV